jgi:hypothetical protein
MTDDDTMALLARVRWLEAEVQRLIEHAAQAEAYLQSLLNSILVACNGTGCLNAHELRQALDAAVRKREVLAAEVMAWRKHDQSHECNTEIVDRNTQSESRILALVAMLKTNNTHALNRAKE